MRGSSSPPLAALLATLLAAAAIARAMPLNPTGVNVLDMPSSTEAEGDRSAGGVDMVNAPGGGAVPIPKDRSCSVGCGVGIGVGCLVAAVLVVFVFIMARRHKRRLRAIWQQRRWLATHKDLPDKPVPAPPPPSKT